MSRPPHPVFRFRRGGYYPPALTGFRKGREDFARRKNLQNGYPIRGPFTNFLKQLFSLTRVLKGRRWGEKIFVWDAGKNFEKRIAGGVKFL